MLARQVATWFDHRSIVAVRSTDSFATFTSTRILTDPVAAAKLQDGPVEFLVMHERPPFHLAFPVTSLATARAFYGDLLGCPEGRCSDRWVDFDFHGHQIVAHLVPGRVSAPTTHEVDGDHVPVPHFGLVLALDEWQVLADRLQTRGTPFVVPPHTRFQGLPGEQATMFLLDPCGNALEFKAFADPSGLFAR